MDEYAYEIHIADNNSPNGWKCVDDTQTVKADDEHEAQEKANQFARSRNYVNYRTRNVRLIKRANNPDGEI